jgi:DNA-binding MarR family transcriptional regulator
MDPGATVRQVKAMEDDGLVSRTPGPEDARVTVVALTDEGRTVYRRIVAVRTAHLDQVLEGWSADDRANLTRLVDRLVEGLSTVPFRPRSEEHP